MVFFWSPVTGSKEQRSAKRHPAPGAPRPARRTLPAGCRAAAWPAACAQSLSSPAFDHEPLSSKWAAAEEEALPQAEVARRRYVRGPQSLPRRLRRLGPVGGGLIEQGGGMGKVATRGGNNTHLLKKNDHVETAPWDNPVGTPLSQRKLLKNAVRSLYRHRSILDAHTRSGLSGLPDTLTLGLRQGNRSAVSCSWCCDHDQVTEVQTCKSHTGVQRSCPVVAVGL